MPTLKLPLKSGINEQDEIGADQLTEAINLSFDEDGILSTRRGISNFGNPASKDVVVLNDCDAITNWTGTDDLASVAQESTLKRRGAASVKFNVDVSASGNDFATLSNANLNAGAGGIDITDEKGFLGFWFFVPAGALTNFTNLIIRLGSDSSNYYEWTVSAAALTAGKYQFIRLLYTAATPTGSPVDTTIDFFRIQLNYTASYGDINDWQIDDIQSYSLTTTPVTSYKFHKRDDFPLAINVIPRMALIIAGTNMFEFDENSNTWTRIDSGLTEFETNEGQEGNRTRWTFAVYRNIFYMCNGVDDYRKFDGNTLTTLPSVKKYRVLIYLKGADKVQGAGADDQPLTLDYTDPAAANADTLPNSIVIGGDEEGVRINILKAINVNNGTLTLACTFNQVFVVNTLSGAESSDAINTQNGGFSQRTTEEVGNAIFYETNNGIDKLQYRRATAGGSEGIDSDPFTDMLQKTIRKIPIRQLNANTALFIKQLKNYYFTFDTDDDNRPDTTLVYSQLVSTRKNRVWTRYDWPTHYDSGTYEDSDGVQHFLLANAVGGQMIEVETGFDDNGIGIPFELATSDFDPVNPKLRNLTQQKTYDFVDITGLMNEGGLMNVEVIVGGETVSEDQITDDNINFDAVATPIGIKATGIFVIGGEGSGEDIDVFPYSKRIPLYGTMGETIKIVITGTDSIQHAKFRQIAVRANGEDMDLITGQMLN